MEILDSVIYPYDVPFLEYFKKFSENVFVVFNPFFKIDNVNNTNYLSSVKLDETIKSEDKVLNYIVDTIGTNGKEIYFQNPEYPTDDDIIKNGKIVKWEYMIKECGFNNFSEISVALRTSIGALKKDFARQDLCEKLISFCDSHQIWTPTEGHFNTLIIFEIKKILKSKNLLEIIIQNEWGDEREEILVDELDNKINYGIKNIYSINKEIIFSIDWDSFYFLFCSKRELIDKHLDYFEGFYCDDEISHSWEFDYRI